MTRPLAIFILMALLAAPVALASHVEAHYEKAATQPGSLPTGNGRGVDWTSDGRYIALAYQTNSPYVAVWERDDTAFTKLSSPSTPPTGQAFGAAWSPDDTHLAIAHVTAPYVTVYGFDGSMLTKLNNPSTTPTGTGTGATWSPDGTMLAVSHVTTPFITIYTLSGGTLTKLSNPTILPAGNANGAAWSPDGTILAVSHATTPFLTLYEVSGTTFTKLSNPPTLPASNAYEAAWTSDSGMLAVAHDNTPFFTVYERSGTSFSKLSNPATLPTGRGQGVSWSPDDNILVVSNLGPPYTHIYNRDGTTLTYDTNLPDEPSGHGWSSAWTPDQSVLASAYAATPNLVIYQTGMTFSLGPPAPDSLLATYEAPDVDLSWTAVDDAELCKYRVYRHTAADGTPGTDGTIRTTSSCDTSTTWTDSNLAPGTYYYRVSAQLNDGTNSEFSSEVSVVVVEPDDSPPYAPTNLVAVGQVGSVALTWTASGSGDVVGYNIHSSSGSNFANSIRLCRCGSTLSYNDTLATAGQVTYYWVAARDSSGNIGSPSEPASAILYDGPPANITSPIATTKGNSRILVEWTALTSQAVTSYSLERSPDNDTWAEISNSTSAYHLDSGLSSETAYYYRVRAVDLLGQTGNYSSAVTSTTSAPPLAPTNLTASSPVAYTMDLTWDAVVGATSYQLEYSRDELLWRHLTTLSTTSVRAGGGGFEPNTTYHWRVRALDLYGDPGPYSTSANTTTLADDGTGLGNPSQTGTPTTPAGGAAATSTSTAADVVRAIVPQLSPLQWTAVALGLLLLAGAFPLTAGVAPQLPIPPIVAVLVGVSMLAAVYFTL